MIGPSLISFLTGQQYYITIYTCDRHSGRIDVIIWKGVIDEILGSSEAIVDRRWKSKLRSQSIAINRTERKQLSSRRNLTYVLVGACSVPRINRLRTLYKPYRSIADVTGMSILSLIHSLLPFDPCMVYAPFPCFQAMQLRTLLPALKEYSR